MTSYIWITTQFEGYHSYPNAPKDVDFLKNRHRHIFGVKVWIEVSVLKDRDIEFFQFKRFVDFVIATTNLNNKSCECIADRLYIDINSKYPNRKIKISIDEDKENGCEKEY
jgi:hypothetical protein